MPISLEQGAAWWAAMLGVEPTVAASTRWGTHNRVMAISSEGIPDCYLEVIAIDPEAPEPGRPRWFGLDNPELREAVRESPRLVHTSPIDAKHTAPLTATLESPRGRVVLDAWHTAR
ncbi:VOC family protein [Arthrobacter oryzae]|uniref:VOC family protein n=1 Tax=Arthrobacter oryzae TaxID=409290 RepID=UPI00273AF73A|nr:VOC family protein [Arthrobacter oryzae]WLQ05968.1 VOC family protein [Arthrobacter oryzae]